MEPNLLLYIIIYICKKVQECLLEMKFRIQINSYMLNSMVMFPFYVLD